MPFRDGIADRYYKSSVNSFGSSVWKKLLCHCRLCERAVHVPIGRQTTSCLNSDSSCILMWTSVRRNWHRQHTSRDRERVKGGGGEQRQERGRLRHKKTTQIKTHKRLKRTLIDLDYIWDCHTYKRHDDTELVLSPRQDLVGRGLLGCTTKRCAQ